jgi:mxaJ protein
MRRIIVPIIVLTFGLSLASAARAQEGPPRQAANAAFRVCADPNNLPYSNDRLEGFENKIASLFAKDLGATPTYTWWPDRRGFIRNTLRANQCDVVIGVPNGYDQVRWTTPYYRSSYAFVFVKDGKFQVRSWDDEPLRRARIGVIAATPPADALIKKGLIGNVAAYRLTIDYTTEYPGKIVDDVGAGKTDLAIVWGPLAGYFAKKAAVPLEVVAVPPLEGVPVPFTYEISMGVRKRDSARQEQLETLLRKHEAQIVNILQEYGVPLVDGPLVRRPDEAKRGVVSERYQ